MSILVRFRGEEVYMFVVRNRSQRLKGRRRETLFQAPPPNPVRGDTGRIHGKKNFKNPQGIGTWAQKWI